MKRRRGLTILDVCSVGACLSLLLSLVVPALQNSAATARREACQNNLRQLGLALHNYHDTYNTFGAAWFARYHDADSQRWTGLFVGLLPYVEQRALYDRFNMVAAGGKSTAPEWPQDNGIHVPLPGFQCPSDTTGPMNTLRGGFPVCNYTGNGGTLPFRRWYSGDAERYWPGGWSTGFEGGDADRSHAGELNGFFSVNSSIGIRHVIDGSSNTLIMTERAARSGAGLWIGVRSNRDENDVITEFSHGSRPGTTWVSASSFHTGGINILMADGSVRFLANNVDSKEDGTGILQLLASRNDGRAIGEF